MMTWMAVAALAAFAVLAVVATAEAEPHGPILIEGDGFCDGQTGVVNCDAADGTEARPYRITGWEIVAAPMSGQPCGKPVHAAIHLCATEAHVIIEDVTIDVPLSTGYDVSDLVDAAPGTGVHIVGGGNVTLRDVHVRTAGQGLDVADMTDRHQVRPMPPVRFENGLITSTAPTSLALVRSTNGNVVLENTRVTATERVSAIQSVFVDDARGAHPPTLGLIGTQISGSRLQAVQMQGGTLSIQDSELAISGTRLPSGGPASGVKVAVVSLVNGARADLRGNTFTYAGTGIETYDAAQVLIRANHFDAGDQDLVLEVARPHAARTCDITLDYNHVGELAVVNDAEDCPVHAPDNWWGGERPEDDQLRGLVEVPSWSPFPLSDMPKATLDATPEAAAGLLVLQGRAEGPVSTLRLEGDITLESASGPGAFRWEVPLNGTPRGDLDLRLHACSDGFCGPPVAWVLRHDDRPLPPVPVLEAQPSVAVVGTTITFDASGSFSPQGTPIVAYRFATGPWTDRPTHTASWTEPGAQAMGLVVRDAEGLESTRTATATVHLRPVAQASSEAVPFLLPLPAIAFLALRRRL